MRTAGSVTPATREGARDGVPVGGAAWFAGGLADRPDPALHDPGALATGGLWAVLATFEGALDLWRFGRRRPAPEPPGDPHAWRGPAQGAWRSSLDGPAYRAGVEEVRRRIREGDVYQVNLCRTLSAPVDPAASPWDLAAVLARGNPAPHAAVLDLPGARVVCASPELLLRVDGDVVTSSPIKGTARTAAGLLPKDEAENVMIVDLVRNDLQRVCRPGSVEVTRLLAVEQHPGLVHLVSTVRGRLAVDPWRDGGGGDGDGGDGWRALLAAVLPAASISGAPKSSALRAIRDLEPVARGPYCGAIGWVDGARRRACLAVGIRTFWWQGGLLNFGTGAGITWGSDPRGEWDETELKARRLVGLASRQQEDT